MISINRCKIIDYFEWVVGIMSTVRGDVKAEKGSVSRITVAKTRLTRQVSEVVR